MTANKNFKYPCNRCDYQSTKQSDLKKHIQSKHEIQCYIYGFQEVRRSLWMKWYDVKFVNMADIAPAPGARGWASPRVRDWAAPGVRDWAAPGARGRAAPGGGCAARGARGWAASGA